MFAYVLPVINAQKITINWITVMQNHYFLPFSSSSNSGTPIGAPPRPSCNQSSRLDKSDIGKTVNNRKGYFVNTVIRFSRLFLVITYLINDVLLGEIRRFPRDPAKISFGTPMNSF